MGRRKGWEGERDGKEREREGERRTIKKVLMLTTQACARFKLSQLQGLWEN